MDENKYWWQSRAVFGGLVAIGAGVAGMIGYTIDSDAQEGLVAACTGIAAGIGGIMAIVGRVKASKKIK